MNGIPSEVDERHEQKIGREIKELEGDTWGCRKSRRAAYSGFQA